MAAEIVKQTEIASSVASKRTAEPQSMEEIEPSLLEKLDLNYAKYYVDVLSKSLATHEIPISEIRANSKKYRGAQALDVDGYERVYDRLVDSADGYKIPIKVYIPDPDRFGAGPYGVHINYHGGGFVFGDLSTDAWLCLRIRNNVGIVVIDVDYRLCPESIWGKNVEDAWSVLQWVSGTAPELNVLRDSITIGGISAGATFCLILQHLARDAGLPLRLAIPYGPSTMEGLHYESYQESPYPSFSEFRNVPGSNWPRLKYFGRYAFPKDTIEQVQREYPEWWWKSLVKCPNPKNLCDTYLITAECDLTRDEAETYGRLLVEHGNRVSFKRFMGMPHAFPHVRVLRQSDEYAEEVSEALRKAHDLPKAFNN